MSVNSIFGGWNEPPVHGANDDLIQLFHKLAAQHIGTPQFKPNFGLSQRAHEIVQLWELYRRAKPKVVCELGIAQAGSFAAWCLLGEPDALIIGIDKDPNDARPRQGEPVDPTIYDGPLSSTSQGGGIHCLRQKQQTTRAISGWSYAPEVMAQLLQILNGRKIDWMWNDGSHDAEGTQRDWDLYWPLVADGGVYAMHDIMPSAHPDCNRSEAYERIKATADYSALFEFRSSRSCDSMGIAAFVK